MSDDTEKTIHLTKDELNRIEGQSYTTGVTSGRKALAEELDSAIRKHIGDNLTLEHGSLVIPANLKELAIVLRLLDPIVKEKR